MSLSYSNKHREIDHELEHVARLHFESETLEDLYTKQFAEDNRTRHKLSCILGVVALLGFMLLDLKEFPEATLSQLGTRSIVQSSFFIQLT